jgi:antitoxin component of MazEF toxin-antitoxin module
MTITTTQKVIKIGTSAGITIPAKQLQRAGVKPGDEIQVSFKPATRPPKTDQLMRDYDKFVAQYGQTLKNLSQR